MVWGWCGLSGALGKVLQRFETNHGVVFQRSLGVLERSWGVLERSWSVFGVILGRLGTVLRRPGTSWGGLGSSRTRLVAILEPSWGVCGHLGTILEPSGASMGRLGTVLGRLGVFFGSFLWLSSELRESSKNLQFLLVFLGLGSSRMGSCGGLGASWTVLRRPESALEADEKL